jgi:hypothetical protein
VLVRKAGDMSLRDLTALIDENYSTAGEASTVSNKFPPKTVVRYTINAFPLNPDQVKVQGFIEFSGPNIGALLDRMKSPVQLAQEIGQITESFAKGKYPVEVKTVSARDKALCLGVLRTLDCGIDLHKPGASQHPDVELMQRYQFTLMQLLTRFTAELFLK